MSRPLRLEYAGALYHVTSRGDRREAIFEDDTDRKSFLSILDKTSGTYNWVCYAYCLMDNHYHLLIETPDANLSKGMRQLNGVYTQTFNRLHNNVGHVFQGRYKAILVEKNSYLLELSRYIVLNPVRATMVASAANWPWSSYLATVGQNKGPACLYTSWLLANFSENEEKAIQIYKLFVERGKDPSSIWTSLHNQIYLGSRKFLDSLQPIINEKHELSEIPSAQRRPIPDTLDHYFTTKHDRNEAICMAYQSGGYTLKEIGDHLTLHYSTVSGIVKNHKSKT